MNRINQATHPINGLTYTTNTTSATGNLGLTILLLLALYLFLPIQMNAATFGEEDSNGPTTNCRLEHFSAIAETTCGANDGRILHDPHINSGTKLPYYIEYTYNGSTKKHGPYSKNKDYHINGLAPGTYKNFTLIDATGCTNNHGNLTIKAATCQTACQPNLVVKNNGTCDVNVYLWEESGDIFRTKLVAGRSWSTTTTRNAKWRVIDLRNDWRNLQFDQHFEVSSDCDQTWTIQPDYCEADTRDCSAEFDHFSAQAESACGQNDGRITTFLLSIMVRLSDTVLITRIKIIISLI